MANTETQACNGTPVGEPEWRARAACVNVDPELFTGPFGQNGVRRAKGICNGCPVRIECLEFALGSAGAFGIWGGLTDGERRNLLRARGTVH